MIDARQDVFVVTEEHVKLARRMYTSWDSCEFGAPNVDPKRPYGNGDVLDDMRNILDRREATDDELVALHRSMQTVLEILLRTGRLEAGRYATPRYYSQWQRCVD